MSSKFLVRVKNLNISFPASDDKKKLIKVVRGVSFDIPKKSIIGFIGESGSGKSVTAKSLLGINTNSKTKAKEFLISDIDMLNEKNYVYSKSKYFRKIRGKKIAYIPQDSLTSLNPTKKVGKQIIEAIKLHNNKLKTKKERFDYAIKMLEEFGIDNAQKRIKQYPYEFSGGMRQRVVIAMMVACSPDVIIADEPTTALDPTIQASVLKLFEKTVEKFNTSILFISHDISVIATLCDYINVFYAGKIVEKGTKQDIFVDPRHPYTWALLASMPELANSNEKLFSLEGQPPDFANLSTGDPFAIRNEFALKIDFEKEPPLFEISKTHYAATWLIHPNAKKVERPTSVQKLIKIIRKEIKWQK